MKKIFAKYWEYCMAGIFLAFIAISLFHFVQEISSDIYLVAFN